MNEATWIEKMRAVEGTLYHVTCAMLREEYDRRDAMQETALRAWEKQSTLRREEYFGTWAVRICINVCKDIRRKSKPVMSTDDVPEIPAPQGDTDFRLMLDNLPDTLRLPVVLYYLDGLTVAETAQALGVPVGTVKFRLHQARKSCAWSWTPRRERGQTCNDRAETAGEAAIRLRNHAGRNPRRL